MFRSEEGVRHMHQTALTAKAASIPKIVTAILQSFGVHTRLVPYQNLGRTIVQQPECYGVLYDPWILTGDEGQALIPKRILCGQLLSSPHIACKFHKLHLLVLVAMPIVGGGGGMESYDQYVAIP